MDPGTFLLLFFGGAAALGGSLGWLKGGRGGPDPDPGVERRYDPEDQFLRGEQAAAIGDQRAKERGEPTVWFGAPNPYSFANQHFLTTGTTGAGKSLIQNALLNSAIEGLPAVGGGRIVFYDASRDVIPFLAPRLPNGMDSLHILNPFDARCSRWEIARDIDTAPRAEQFADTIIPRPKNSSSEPIWALSAQNALTSVILYCGRQR